MPKTKFKKHQLAFIGAGYVGLVSGTALAEIGHQVILVDNNKEKIAKLKKGVMPIYEPGLDKLVAKNVKAKRLSFTSSLKDAVNDSDVIFIAVNTPPLPTGKADLSYVAAAAREIAEVATSYKVVVDKSTVPVQTGERVAQTITQYTKRGLHNKGAKIDFDIVSNPEFLREGSAIKDFLEPDRIVVGVSNQRAEKIMREIYAPIDAPFVVTDVKSAELIKHASNSFLALKISFANALAKICELSGANIDRVAQGMGMDSRINTHFLNAGIGYGGSCFPKDVSAFITIAEELGYKFGLLEEVEKINQQARESFLLKVEQALWVIKGKKIAVWGLAFKPNTDDMRNAPSVPIIEHLHADGATVHAYDPEATATAKIELGNKLTYCKNMYEPLKNADALVILTDWDEFKEPNWDKVSKLLKNPIIIDGRNLFSPSDMSAKGLVYHSVGRG
ncbi:MAG: UDP-glucose 6-dehydrogenase [Candidatus Andersenbacteria bacterium RIFCSPHIGHO2_12_FULL_46_9]|nr:MAG: Nucleotide sugar dehydrogenase [Parcubacteria group bacterium GW2011_GWA2_45_14]OGY34582.1 MAG: UDP-glucose 6-dehydrogenase [Candidatus Andersenbacteria bacterium RIFCSPHIGHO2_02_FULL_46_16]OGY36374.1 MAG: UDP-glucose 6-dehydrogenase [Candidatus Andersenbacteria bacterium RIFCSPHIGHO2_12_FULL_46_9]OGY37867.1 MAG: UDP-glucose 6-dehydrogenase [Candidatus Andersenbacteria bacterium RIFCSPLOWO2_02_FULL_46_11]OGY42663.1 MAG: UDP-glucose 6-dehydrogenase [Candidatus Andersenbacteria bacterium 